MPRLSLWGVTPDLVLLVVVAWSLLRGNSQGFPLALAGGLILDFLSGGPFGAATLSLTVSSMMASWSQHSIARDSIWLPLAAASLATVLYNGIYLVILQVSGRPITWVLGFFQVIVPSMAWNALAMYPAYGLLRRLHLRTVFGQSE